jgi:hypothetical protein
MPSGNSGGSARVVTFRALTLKLSIVVIFLLDGLLGWKHIKNP